MLRNGSHCECERLERHSSREAKLESPVETCAKHMKLFKLSVSAATNVMSKIPIPFFTVRTLLTYPHSATPSMCKLLGFLFSSMRFEVDVYIVKKYIRTTTGRKSRNTKNIALFCVEKARAHVWACAAECASPATEFKPRIWWSNR